MENVRLRLKEFGMSILVDISVKEKKLKEQIRKLFKGKNFTIIKTTDVETPHYKIIYLPDKYLKNDIEMARKQGRPCQYVFIVKKRPNGKMLNVFFNGNTVYVHFLQEEPIKEIKERILDDIFLKKYINENNPLLKLVFSYSNLAFSVIDRSFRSLYRNNTHKTLTHKENCTRKLCWHSFHYLDNRNIPCEGCPSYKLFKLSKNILPKNGVFKKNLIPTCDYMIQRLRRKTAVTCIRLEVSPVIDRDRKRIVASMEFVSKIDLHKDWGKRLLNIETIIENSLRGILDEQYFTRARVFLYSSEEPSVLWL